MAPPRYSEDLAQRMKKLRDTGKYNWTDNPSGHFYSLPGEGIPAFLSCYQIVVKAKVDAHVKHFSQYRDGTRHSAQSLANDARHGGGHCHILDYYHQNVQSHFRELLEAMLVWSSRIERATSRSLKNRPNTFENGDVLFINRYPGQTELVDDPNHASPWHVVVVNKKDQRKADKVEIIDLAGDHRVMAKRKLTEVIPTETMEFELWHFRVDWKMLDERCKAWHARDCTPNSGAGPSGAGGRRTG